MLDIGHYITECTVELTRDDICAVWEGWQAAKNKDIAYVAVLNLSQCSEPPMDVPLPAISHNNLVRAQRQDTVIGELIGELKDHAGKCGQKGSCWSCEEAHA